MFDTGKKQQEIFESLDRIQDGIRRLKAGQQLLGKIWNAVGPYGYGKPIPDDLIREMNDYFGFDDSE